MIYAGYEEAEAEIIRRDHCPCGGKYGIVSKRRTFLKEVTGRPVDVVDVACLECGFRHTFFFDVSAFTCKC